MQIPFSQLIGMSFVLGMMRPKAIHMKSADKMKNLSSFFTIIGTMSIRAAVNPKPREMKKLYINQTPFLLSYLIRRIQMNFVTKREKNSSNQRFEPNSAT